MSDDESKGNSKAYDAFAKALNDAGHALAEYEKYSDQDLLDVMKEVKVGVLDRGIVLKDFRKHFPLPTNTGARHSPIKVTWEDWLFGVIFPDKIKERQRRGAPAEPKEYDRADSQKRLQFDEAECQPLLKSGGSTTMRQRVAALSKQRSLTHNS